MKTSTLLVLLLGIGYHFCVSPRLDKAQKRAHLVEQWNLINEANEDGSGVYYSTSGLFDQTLTIYLSKSDDRVAEDQFLGEVLQGDEATNEMKNLGFKNVKCGDHVERLRVPGPHPATGKRELDLETVS